MHILYVDGCGCGFGQVGEPVCEKTKNLGSD